MSKQPKTCYFCGRSGNMSKEHAWPQWLGQDVEVRPTRWARTSGFQRSAEDAFTEHETVVTTAPGSVLTTRVREVCRACNSGWMSGLETRARPLLERLWVGSYALGHTALTVNEASIVATWATKTAWMHERVARRQPTATSAMRSYLMSEQLPPEYTSVWLGKHEGEANFRHHLGHVHAAREGEAWDHPDRRRVLVATMAFKGLALLVRTDDGWGVPRMNPKPSYWHPIWPVTSTVSWPPTQTVSDDDIAMVPMQFTQWMRMPDLSFFYRLIDGVRYVKRN